MTDAELIEWAAQQCGWEHEGVDSLALGDAEMVVTPSTLAPAFIVLKYRDGGETNLENFRHHIDALALQLWRKWIGLDGYEMKVPVGVAVSLIAGDSLGCIRAIYESGVLDD